MTDPDPQLQHEGRRGGKPPRSPVAVGPDLTPPPPPDLPRHWASRPAGALHRGRWAVLALAAAAVAAAPAILAWLRGDA